MGQGNSGAGTAGITHAAGTGSIVRAMGPGAEGCCWGMSSTAQAVPGLRSTGAMLRGGPMGTSGPTSSSGGSQGCSWHSQGARKLCEHLNRV